MSGAMDTTLTHTDTDAAMAATDAIAELGAMLRRHAPREGLWPTVLPRVWAIRLDAPGGEMAHAVQPASLCVIAQGAKEVHLGDERPVSLEADVTTPRVVQTPQEQARAHEQNDRQRDLQPHQDALEPGPAACSAPASPPGCAAGPRS